MDLQYPLFTLKTDCQDCYKCLRECPVKAIKIVEGSANIIPEFCIACGHCVEICPAKAKQVRDDLGRAKLLIKEKNTVYASLAPSWISEFKGVSEAQIISAIRRLGFAGVSETALGAEEVSANVAKILANGENRIYVSTACPSAVEFICKYLPDKTDLLTSFDSPLLAHCKMLREEFGDNIKTVFFGPCIAKKYEADRHPDVLNIALTFDDLRKWLEKEEISLEEIKPSQFDIFTPRHSEEGAMYPIEGGMIETLKPYHERSKYHYISISGIKNIERELRNLHENKLTKPVFIEALACEGGCVNGPCSKNEESGLEERMDVLNNSSIPSQIKRSPSINIEQKYEPIDTNVRPAFEEVEMRRALLKVGKRYVEDELNCGGCGYGTCRNFAKALLQGKAETDMCVSYMRQQAQKKANALIRCIPAAIVLVDARLNIMEWNDRFLKLFFHDDEHLEDYPDKDIESARLEDFIPFVNLFQAALKTEQDIHKEHLKVDDRLYDITVFNINKKQVLGGIIQDVTGSEMKREQIAQRAREVINKNLSTVQQIACTLGEHMAETEILLRSIAEGFSYDNNKSYTEKKLVQDETTENIKDK